MKTAIVTGSSYGLGFSISNSLLASNFKVYGVSRSDPKIINENFFWIKADLLNDDEIKLISDKVVEEKVDLLVNNAGVVFAEKSLEFTQSVFDSTFGLNLIAPIKLTSMFKYKLIGGIIVNISSTSDRFAEYGLGMYCASKAAIDIYFDAVAIENKETRVLSILPVYLDTPMLTDIAEKLKFSTDGAAKPEKFAEAVMQIVFSKDTLSSGSRIIVTTGDSLDDTKDPEKLWHYNMDTKEFKKLK